jgi:predicted DNA-binding transcriptional regulator AlpA
MSASQEKTSRAKRPVMTDAKGVAELMSTNPAAVWRQLGEGMMPAPLMIGGEERWRIAEIRHWIQEGCPDRRSWERRWYR